MKHKISTTNRGKKESQSVKIRTRINAGLQIHASKNIKLDDVTKALKEDKNGLRWNDPILSQKGNQIAHVLVPLQFSDEDLEQTSSESISEHLRKLSSIETDVLNQCLENTALRLMATGIPGAGLIIPVLESHTTSPAN